MIQRRLDYVFVLDSFQDSTHQVEILTGIQSDHSPILIQCRSPDEERRGPSHWKFNNSLLLDSEYIELANSEISDLLDPMTLQTGDPTVKWEFIKYNIRNSLSNIRRKELSAEENPGLTEENELSFMRII